RLAVSLGLHVGRDRHLADVELELAHHGLEEPVRRLDVGEGERDARRVDLAALERQRMRVIVEGRAQRGNMSVDAHELSFLAKRTGTPPDPFWNIFRAYASALWALEPRTRNRQGGAALVGGVSAMLPQPSQAR